MTASKVPAGVKVADVELVDDIVRQAQAAPTLVRPGEVRRDDLGGAMDPLRLKAGGRVGAFLGAVQPVKIAAARRHVVAYSIKIAVLTLSQGLHPLHRRDQPDFHGFGLGRPHPEAAAAIFQGDGSQGDGAHYHSPESKSVIPRPHRLSASATSPITLKTR